MNDFEIIYKQHFQNVYKYTLSLCHNETIAEEITQETFFKALKNIDKFDGKCKLIVWLCQIAKNTYYSYYQKNKRNNYILEECDIAITNHFEYYLLDKESSFEIHQALHKIEEPYKEVFSLRVFGELSFKQIGTLFNKTESWARVTYHRAKLKIREEML